MDSTMILVSLLTSKKKTPLAAPEGITVCVCVHILKESCPSLGDSHHLAIADLYWSIWPKSLNPVNWVFRLFLMLFVFYFLAHLPWHETIFPHLRYIPMAQDHTKSLQLTEGMSQDVIPSFFWAKDWTMASNHSMFPYVCKQFSCKRTVSLYWFLVGIRHCHSLNPTIMAMAPCCLFLFDLSEVVASPLRLQTGISLRWEQMRFSNMSQTLSRHASKMWWVHSTLWESGCFRAQALQNTLQ